MEVRDASSAVYRVEPEAACADDDVPSGFKHTEVGVIPEDWVTTSFGDVVGSYIDYRGRTPRKLGMDWGGGEILGLSANNVQMGRIAPEKEANFGSDALYKKWMLRGDCEQGDVLLTTEAPLGNIAQIPDTKKYILSQRVLLIKPRDRILRNYLFHLMTAEQFQAQLYVNASGTTATGIQRARLDLVPISLPESKTEQEAIAEALSDADALIESLQQLIAKRRAIKQGAMQALLTGRQRLPGFIGEWQTKRLGDVADTDPENLGASTREEFVFRYIALEDVDVGTLRNFTEQVFQTAPSRARRVLRNGDVLVSTVRPNLLSHLLFKMSGTNWVCSTGFCVVRCKTGLAHPDFVFALVLSDIVRRQIDALISGSNYPAINSNEVRALEIPVPSHKEQIAIADILSDMDAGIEALEARLAKTRALKAGMMQQLLTGRIRLPLERTA